MDHFEDTEKQPESVITSENFSEDALTKLEKPKFGSVMEAMIHSGETNIGVFLYGEEKNEGGGSGGSSGGSSGGATKDAGPPPDAGGPKDKGPAGGVGPRKNSMEVLLHSQDQEIDLHLENKLPDDLNPNPNIH
jgi:hypothetical protein